MLQISLIDNKLTVDDLEDRMAQVQNRQQMTTADVVKQITGKGSILKPTECNAVINDVLEAITTNLREGYGFTCDYFSLEPSVSGVFVNDQDRFDRARHQVELNLRLGSPIKQALADVKVEVLPHDVPVPVIKQTYDHGSLTTNEQLTPGQTLVIKGQRLKIEDMSAAAQGVFLLNTQKNEEVKVAVLHENVDKTLHAKVPESLKKGTYRLEVRTAVNKSKEVRTGSAPFILAVV
jgi:hypothetical protein